MMQRILSAKNFKLYLIGFIFNLFVTKVSANQVTVVNNITASSVCPNGNTVTIFYTENGVSKQQLISPGTNFIVRGNFSDMPGIGIQVNNWYWTSVKLPVEAGTGSQAQNPDNSGAQFAITDSCALSQSAAWFGKGIATYLIANVTVQKDQAGCTLTLSYNNYTDAVTPQCCAPPLFPTGVCQGPWGVTNSGQAWPPLP